MRSARSCCASSPIGLHEFQFNFFRDNFLLIGFLKKLPHSLAAFAAVIERELVNVHSDESINPIGIQTAGELNGISHRFLAMIETVLDAVLDVLSDAFHHGL